MLDNVPFLPYLISAFIGIGLAAATGFRIFLPMFAVSLASYMGWIPQNENFQINSYYLSSYNDGLYTSSC